MFFFDLQPPHMLEILCQECHLLPKSRCVGPRCNGTGILPHHPIKKTIYCLSRTYIHLYICIHYIALGIYRPSAEPPQTKSPSNWLDFNLFLMPTILLTPRRSVYFLTRGPPGRALNCSLDSEPPCFQMPDNSLAQFDQILCLLAVGPP